MKNKLNNLTEKQRIFCEEYLVDLNAKQAAIRAKYSPKTAENQASRLLTKVKVQEYLQKRMNDRSERTEISADFVLTNLKDIANACKSDNPTAATRALELLGKHLKLFTDKFEFKSDIDFGKILTDMCNPNVADPDQIEGNKAKVIEIEKMTEDRG